MKKDAKVASFIRQEGKDALLKLKRENFNLKLEDCVNGVDQLRRLDVVDDHIVARMGIIYLTPRNHWGRAPFYSSEKIIGSLSVKTLWFNMSIILLMGIVAVVLLLTDCPGKYLRKD